MPVYEFYCENCHTIYSFFSRRINTRKKPACPNCKRPDLERVPSIFAISMNREEPDGMDLPDIDEGKLEQVMMSLASEAEKIDENDPRQAASLMKKLFDATGLQMGGEMEEALKRMEAGEDPEKIEEEMGDIFDDEDILKNLGSKKAAAKFRKKYMPPYKDETLYEL